jgi:hypothetical protein
MHLTSTNSARSAEFHAIQADTDAIDEPFQTQLEICVGKAFMTA